MVEVVEELEITTICIKCWGYLYSFIRPVLLYNKVIVAVLYGLLVSLSNQRSASQSFHADKGDFDDEELTNMAFLETRGTASLRCSCRQ